MFLSWHPLMNLPAMHEYWNWHSFFFVTIPHIAMRLIKLRNELKHCIFSSFENNFLKIIYNVSTSIFDTCRTFSQLFINSINTQQKLLQVLLRRIGQKFTNTSIQSSAKTLFVRWNVCNIKEPFFTIQMWRMYDLHEVNKSLRMFGSFSASLLCGLWGCVLWHGVMCMQRDTARSLYEKRCFGRRKCHLFK